MHRCAELPLFAVPPWPTAAPEPERFDEPLYFDLDAGATMRLASAVEWSDALARRVRQRTSVLEKAFWQAGLQNRWRSPTVGSSRSPANWWITACAGGRWTSEAALAQWRVMPLARRPGDWLAGVCQRSS